MKFFGEKRSSAPSRGGGTKKRLIVTLCVVFLAVAAIVLGYAVWEKPPELAPNPGGDSVSDADNQPVPGGEDVDGEDEAFLGDPLLTERNDGVYTFLLVGVDHASNSTDTIIVGRFDTREHTIDCASIPRDTLINVGWRVSPRKINAVYPAALNNGRDGAEDLKNQIKNLLGFDVDCYAIVSLEAVERSVDALGGIYFDVPVDMDYDDPVQDFHVHLKQGYQLLDGSQTLGVFRFRKSYSGGDIQRIGVQQDLLKSMAGQMISLGNIPNLGQVISILTETVDTDLTAANMAFFARQMLMCSSEDINFHTLPFSVGCLINGVSYVSCDVDSWLEIVNEHLSPFTEPVTRAGVNILTSNSSGTSISSTTGTINGGTDIYCSRCEAARLSPKYHAPGFCPLDAPAQTPAPTETEPPAQSEAPQETQQPEAPQETQQPEDPTVTDDPASESPVIEEIVIG